MKPEEAKRITPKRLIRLNRLPCFYYRTPASSIPKLSKAELGLPETGILYGCPQNLFKIHPDLMRCWRPSPKAIRRDT